MSKFLLSEDLDPRTLVTISSYTTLNTGIVEFIPMILENLEMRLEKYNQDDKRNIVYAMNLKDVQSFLSMLSFDTKENSCWYSNMKVILACEDRLFQLIN